MKVRDVLQMLEQDGWYLARTRGSHRQYKHPRKPGLVTGSIFKQAGIEKTEAKKDKKKE